MIQTKIFVKYASGLNLDMDPKEITRPKGSANTSVSAKIRQVVSNPSSNFRVTFQNDSNVIAIIYSFVLKLVFDLLNELNYVLKAILLRKLVDLFVLEKCLDSLVYLCGKLAALGEANCVNLGIKN